jgi:hypothetical protein
MKQNAIAPDEENDEPRRESLRERAENLAHCYARRRQFGVSELPSARRPAQLCETVHTQLRNRLVSYQPGSDAPPFNGVQNSVGAYAV